MHYTRCGASRCSTPCEQRQERCSDLHYACASLCERPIDVGDEGLRRPYYAFGAGIVEKLALVGEDEEEDKHLSITQLRARRERIELVGSIVPLRMVDSK